MTPEQIIYDEAVRALDQQIRLLDELRSRTAIVLAASGLAVSFFGTSALKNGASLTDGLAIIFFVLTAGLCIAVLIPKFTAWNFVASPTILIEDHVDHAERNDTAKLQRYLALKFEEYYDRNGVLLKPLFFRFWLACICLSIDLGLWLLALAVH